MSINVDRSNTDMFYRYKMPRIVAKVEGSGNGIKTVIPNIADVSRALSRLPQYTLKYFGYELGAQTSIDTKNDRFIVNGSHDAMKLQEMLDGFISKFVLCQNCRNPETELDVNAKKGLIKERCAACGYVGACDLAHRLSSYILKNPPDGGKKKSKKDKKNRETSGNVSPNADANAEQGDTSTASPETEMLPSEEFNNCLQEKSGFDEHDWGDDVVGTGADFELSAAAKKLALDADIEKSEKERLDIFHSFVKKAKANESIDAKTLLNEAERLEVSDKAPVILVHELLDDDAVKQVHLYRKLFLHFVHKNKKAQRNFLGGIEQKIGEGKYKQLLMPKLLNVFNALYDNDIISEEAFITWANKPTKKYVSMETALLLREKAKKFIIWLQEAEEEESENENGALSDDDDDDADSDESLAMPNGKENGNKSEDDDEEDDDLDIDAI